jgi:hypothetical protein
MGNTYDGIMVTVVLRPDVQAKFNDKVCRQRGQPKPLLGRLGCEEVVP